MEQQALSVREFMAAYGVKRTFTYKLLARGEIESVKAGRRRLILASSAVDWFERLRGDASNR